MLQACVSVLVYQGESCLCLSLDILILAVTTWQCEVGTLNSTYIEVAFNEKSAIMKQNLHTKCLPLTAMLNTLAIMKSLYEIAAYNDFLGI